MTFGDAIVAMQAGKLVRRAGWNGKNMHIYLEDGYTMCKGRGTERTYEPAIHMYTAQGKHQPGWHASQQDMLSHDWEVVPE